MNSRCCVVEGGDGQEGKSVGDLRGSSKLEKHNNMGHAQKFSKRHLYLDLNGPAEPEVPAIPVPVMNNVPAHLPVEEFPGRNLEEAFDGSMDWASLNIGPDGRFTFYKPQPMTEAERNESNWRLALNSVVYEAQERDDAYYQGRLDNLGSEHDLPLENQSLDLDIDP